MVLKVGVLGYGHWGPNLVQTFVECPRTQMIAVCDLDNGRLTQAQQRYPDLLTTSHFHTIVEHADIDLVAIATPVGTHYELALAALRAGKHVLIEKPMTETVAQAEHLLREAEERGLKIAVDHVLLFSPAVQHIKALVEKEALGELFYYDSFRANLGLFQKDVDVMWDLAVHDLAILDYLHHESPNKVSCESQSHFKGQPADIAYLTLKYPSGFIAHINVSWLSPIKSRRILIGGSQQMLVYDDLDDSAKIKLYDKSVKFTQMNQRPQLVYHVGDQLAPYLKNQPALRAEVENIADCLENGTPLLSDGQMGLRIVKLLEQLTKTQK